jgi:hypothetical protein
MKKRDTHVMNDIVIAAFALFGVAVVAATGYRFIGREDERFERIALGDSPAAWGEATADATLIR